MTNTAEEYSFACLPIVEKEKNIIKKIISSMYYNNMQIKKEEDFSTFHKVDLLLLSFFNTIGYNRQLVLAYFVDNSAYRRFASNISCCDNCFYSLYKSNNTEEDFSLPK